MIEKIKLNSQVLQQFFSLQMTKIPNSDVVYFVHQSHYDHFLKVKRSEIDTLLEEYQFAYIGWGIEQFPVLCN
jgi:hypothetical protein